MQARVVGRRVGRRVSAARGGRGRPNPPPPERAVPGPAAGARGLPIGLPRRAARCSRGVPLVRSGARSGLRRRSWRRLPISGGLPGCHLPGGGGLGRPQGWAAPHGRDAGAGGRACGARRHLRRSERARERARAARRRSPAGCGSVGGRWALPRSPRRSSSSCACRSRTPRCRCRAHCGPWLLRTPALARARRRPQSGAHRPGNGCQVL